MHPPGGHFSEGKVAAVGPTSAMICCAESTPRPGTSATRSTASWCWRSRLAISWSSWPICCSRNCKLLNCKLLQRHLQQPSVHGLEIRARAERTAQLFRRGAQALISQTSQSHRVGFTLSQRLQHAPGTGAQQIRVQAGQLHVGLFQQRLHLVLQAHVITRELILPACHRPPQTLLGIGHKAQRQFPGHQPLHQAFGIGEITLASPSYAIGLRLRQVQRSGLPSCAFWLLAYRLPIPFQRFPHSLSISTSDTTTASIFLWTSIPATLLVPPGWERRVYCGYLNQGRGLSPLPQGKTTTPNYSLNHARSGSDSWTASTYPLGFRPRRSRPLQSYL